ncbi:hypothetical protein H4R33_006347 [Dimargaris cristalligena]|uniref:Uncharacterized protein n=1 Tax=Dimargaris cristalligena TaxID=215637 RepID=A0A4P9ZRN6_9FUNG|nr:hypothetical protein H4R33_006347 [Dimargaris cristalligena]RKP36206.1 hypothetical protein BJ085DRAFT_27389 [Dimargaris cristalligena]|eukprot:RKP36206.1 hypothetical protein BJ085DRAFT_27389 [Dimargaris cristalligena]
MKYSAAFFARTLAAVAILALTLPSGLAVPIPEETNTSGVDDVKQGGKDMLGSAVLLATGAGDILKGTGKIIVSPFKYIGKKVDESLTAIGKGVQASAKQVKDGVDKSITDVKNGVDTSIKKAQDSVDETKKKTGGVIENLGKTIAGNPST